MDPKVQIALLAPIATLSVALLGEFFLQLRGRRATRESAITVYRKYTDPLAFAGTALVWRLNEIFNERGGGFYLQKQFHLVRYEHYKAISTLYRLAAFLAWLQGLKRELFFVPRTKPTRTIPWLQELKRQLLFVPSPKPTSAIPLDEKLRQIEKAFADGDHVEVNRLKSLMQLWNISESQDAKLDNLATKLDYGLDRQLNTLNTADASCLSDDDTLTICRFTADTVTEGLRRPRVSDQVLLETKSRTIEYISVRENWIYRDWQTAIGDVMLRDSANGPRRYEVVGFGEFERMCTEGDPDTRKWLSRLNGVLEELDVNGEPAKDARIQQLSEIFGALCSVVIEINRTEGKRSPISKETIDIAQINLKKYHTDSGARR